MRFYFVLAGVPTLRKFITGCVTKITFQLTDINLKTNILCEKYNENKKICVRLSFQIFSRDEEQKFALNSEFVII